MNTKRPGLIFISSHPIQYFVPLYQYIAAEGKFDLSVWYCSNHGVEETADREFGTSIKWDIDLLSGYTHLFLNNRSFQPSIYSFWGLFNPGIIKKIYRQPKSIIVIHGWNYLTNIIAMVAARLCGHEVCLRAETPLLHEEKSGKTKSLKRKLVLQYGLFPWFKKFLYIGKQNHLLYKFYKIEDKRLFFTPYAVDNKRFRAQAAEYKPQRNEIRARLGIPPEHTVILFSGKYIEKKRPLDLLNAYKIINNGKITLVMMGEGSLRNEMEDFINRNKLPNVLLTGFVNQHDVSKYYAAADLFVMCSGLEETWGLSVNEAMNFGLPLAISDYTGCAGDLVKQGINGYVFETGNTEALAGCLNKMINDKDWLEKAGQQSQAIVDQYDFAGIVAGLEQAAASL